MTEGYAKAEIDCPACKGQGIVEAFSMLIQRPLGWRPCFDCKSTGKVAMLIGVDLAKPGSGDHSAAVAGYVDANGVFYIDRVSNHSGDALTAQQLVAEAQAAMAKLHEGAIQPKADFPVRYSISGSVREPDESPLLQDALVARAAELRNERREAAFMFDLTRWNESTKVQTFAELSGSHSVGDVIVREMQLGTMFMLEQLEHWLFDPYYGPKLGTPMERKLYRWGLYPRPCDVCGVATFVRIPRDAFDASSTGWNADSWSMPRHMLCHEYATAQGAEGHGSGLRYPKIRNLHERLMQRAREADERYDTDGHMFVAGLPKQPKKLYRRFLELGRSLNRA